MIQYKRTATPSTLPPLRDDGMPLLGHFRQFRANQLKFWLETGQMGPLMRVRFGPRELWVVTDAEMLREMLQLRARNYPRSSQLIGEDKLDTGKTVFNAPTWDAWLWRRRLLQPAFHRKHLAAFAEAIVDETSQLMREWHSGSILPVKSVMKSLTMRIIGRTMFSAPLQETEVLQECFEQIGKYSIYRNASLFTLPTWLPLPLYRRTRKALQIRHELINKLVSERLASGEPQGDLLDMLIAANLEDGTRFSGQHIVDEMMSIIFAGHETTSMTLTWLFYLLSQYPTVELQVRHEIETVLGERLPTLNDLEKMPYTSWLIQETMRLYPSVYLTLREALEADQLGNVPVPAGTELVVNIRALHRDTRYWQEPERFYPERFSPERSLKRDKHAYMPAL